VQVKWNKVSGKYLASSHEGEIKLWDIRAGQSPVQYINAHLSRIYDLDWSSDDENHLVTTSQDATVKFWNVASPTRAENTIKMAQPVWCVRYTPFGHGLLTLPFQSVVRGENCIMLWNNNDLTGRGLWVLNSEHFKRKSFFNSCTGTSYEN
jgi:WD40 repeat protein